MDWSNILVMDGGGRMNNEDLIDEFQLYQKSVDRSDWTIRSCNSTLNMFLEEIGDKDLTEIGIDELKEFFVYIKDRPGNNGRDTVSAETVRKHINNLASFYNYLEFEEYITKSPVDKFRQKFLNPYLKSHQSDGDKRQIVSVQEMRELIQCIMNPRDKAICLTLAKTGIRAGELLELDVGDIKWDESKLRLKENNKRTNTIVFFDGETARGLKSWMNIRDGLANEDEDALFVTQYGNRMSHKSLIKMVKKYAKRVDLHDENSKHMEDKFTPHCFRHWFTTELRKSGMSREYIKELRGDTRSETMDGYYHITEEELKEEYLDHIPRLGV